MRWLSLRINSFRYAFRGFGLLFKGQINICIHIVAAVLAVGLGFIFRITQGEWLAVILSIVAVIAAEAFNTSIEKLTDIVSPEFNREAGKVKDIAAAAVLIISLGALVVGTVVFLPLILNLF
ncbi:MAG: hypothetical protein A2X11_05170 [Bacteroidetes bacterium GWE2_42_24]|nr:MAG: hypothetical protein A2X11_05170 [Bacteroidetes bacterium GWE2_42_24]OFY26615.1 MAG: hypothetical protein A2X09_03400 [Bacteroidetes bacterium GWF2_43_11]